MGRNALQLPRHRLYPTSTADQAARQVNLPVVLAVEKLLFGDRQLQIAPALGCQSVRDRLVDVDLVEVIADHGSMRGFASASCFLAVIASHALLICWSVW